MSVENGEIPIPICPNWKNYIKTEEYALALCGAVSPDERSLFDWGEENRLPECPYFKNSEAFEHPCILEFPGEKTFEFFGEILYGPNVIAEAKLPGIMGIKELEEIWDQEVEKFIQRHSKPS